MPDEEHPEVDELVDKTTGRHPETVSWEQYVGTKQSLGKKLETATHKVGNLEEQLKGATSAEDAAKLAEELTTTKTKLEEVQAELTGLKDASAAEKRAILVKKGIPEEDVKDMSEAELNKVIKVIGSFRPSPDLGAGGGGAGSLEGKSPLALAAMGYEKSNK